MSVPLLQRFSSTVVEGLLTKGLIVIGPGRREAVIERLAGHLGSVRHGSLVSSITRSLLSDDDVEELFAEDEDIKALVDDMDRASAGLGPQVDRPR